MKGSSLVSTKSRLKVNSTLLRFATFHYVLLSVFAFSEILHGVHSLLWRSHCSRHHVALRLSSHNILQMYTWKTQQEHWTYCLGPHSAVLLSSPWCWLYTWFRLVNRSLSLDKHVVPIHDAHLHLNFPLSVSEWSSKELSWTDKWDDYATKFPFSLNNNDNLL